MIRIEVFQKSARLESVEKIVEKAIKAKYPEASIRVSRKEPAESRSARFDEAQSIASDAKSVAEELRDELQEWHDNLPENLQDGDKVSQLDDAVSSLEEFIEACEQAEGVSVDFPGMY